MNPKHNETYQNMILGSNGVDWVRSLRKIPTLLRGTYFCINSTSSHCFAPSFMQLRNDPKCTQTLFNTPKQEFRVQWLDWVRPLRKIRMWLCGTNFCINCTSSHHFAPSFTQLRNDNRWTQTLWNLPKHEFRVQWVWIGCVRCEKSRHDFVARTFPLIAPVHTILHRVSWVTKQSQMHPNTMQRTKTWV